MFVCARLHDVYLFMFFLARAMFCVSSRARARVTRARV
jgi:hypothetical protein